MCGIGREVRRHHDLRHLELPATERRAGERLAVLPGQDCWQTIRWCLLWPHTADAKGEQIVSEICAKGARPGSGTVIQQHDFIRVRLRLRQPFRQRFGGRTDPQSRKLFLQVRKKV